MSKHRPSTTGTPPTTTRRVRIYRRPTTVSRASSVAALLARVVR